MGTLEKNTNNTNEHEIVFSKAVLSRKRIYYIDIKRNRNNELYLIITERKKNISKDPSQPVAQFEKHKIFLYKEDLDNFINALSETIMYVNDNDITKDNYITPKNNFNLR